MSKNKLYVFTTLVAMYCSMLQAQNDTIANLGNEPNYVELMDSNYKNSSSVNDDGTQTRVQTDIDYSGGWIIGAGINMIEDSGHQKFADFFTFKHKNFGNPFMLSVEYLTNSKFSFGVTFLSNKYQSGKEVQGLTIQNDDEPNYFAIDFGSKMFFRKILTKHKFTPYITAGFGYRYISGYQAVSQTDNLVDVPKTRDITINTGLGVYYWFNKNWGLNINYIGKFALKAGANKNYKTNHLASSLGVFYRFNSKYFN